MESQEQRVSVVVVDEHGYRLGESLGEDRMLTLVALASEDPACWDDMEGAWPRYCSPAVPEFIGGLAIERVELAVALQSVSCDGAWVVIDLVQKRVVAGPDSPMAGRDVELDIVDGGSRLKRCTLGVHLPPWWEYHENADSRFAFSTRETQIVVPTCERQVLYGEPLLRDLAERMLRRFAASAANDSSVLEDLRSRYEMTVGVHRDWLMTPRLDLGGRTPREQMHGAHRWLEQIVSTQQTRCVQGSVLFALPSDVTGYETAPMDFVELVIYFDLCRELISAGWIWCRNVGLRLDKSTSRIPLEAHRRLVEFLRDIQSQWMHEPDEDGLSPACIIECSRARVPCGSGIEILGLETQRGERHVGNCDCPICNLMADNAFGPSFIMFDGYHLELDDEFAFSAHATREDWEAERGDDGELDVDLLDNSGDQESHISPFQERDAHKKDDDDFDMEPQEMLSALERAVELVKASGSTKANGIVGNAMPNTAEDEFAPVWSNSMGSDPLPGDPQGYLKFAFLLAEIISLLQSAATGCEEIQLLNERFTCFRQSDEAGLVTSSRRLSESLETCATQFPQLVSRVADFQSRLDEHIRAKASGADCDFPV